MGEENTGKYDGKTDIVAKTIKLAIWQGEFRRVDVEEITENPPHRSTISRAYTQLRDNGWIELRDRADGIYVAGPEAKRIRRVMREMLSDSP